MLVEIETFACLLSEFVKVTLHILSWSMTLLNCEIAMVALLLGNKQISLGREISS